MNIEPRRQDVTDARHAIVSIINNPLKPSDVTHYRTESTLEEPVKLSAFVDLGWEDVVVAHNGLVVEKTKYCSTMVKAGDHVTLCPILTGDGDGKSVLRIVALIAVSIAAPGIATAIAPGATSGVLGGIGAAVTVIGGMVINAFLPATPISQSAPDPLSNSPSYGIDSGTNTANQGAVVPVIYGKTRVVPNRVGLYTELIEGTSNQDLNLLYALGEGVISAVHADTILIDDQPIGTFPAGELTVGSDRLGTQSQQPPDFFTEGAIVAISKGQQLLNIVYANDTFDITDNDTFQTHTTSGAVTGFRIDVATNGLYTFGKTTGDFSPQDIYFDIQYRPQGGGAWSRVEGEPWESKYVTYNPTAAAGALLYTTIAEILKDADEWVTDLRSRRAYGNIGVEPYSQPVHGWKFKLRASSPFLAYADGNGWLTCRSFDGDYAKVSSTRVAPPDKTKWLHTPALTVGGRNGRPPSYAGTLTPRPTFSAISTLPRISGETQAVVRGSFGVTGLASGVYEIRVRAIGSATLGEVIYELFTPETEVNLFSRNWQTNWTFVNEINNDAEETAYVNTAMLSLRARLSDRLSRVPNVSVVVSGRLVKVYERDPATFELSSNVEFSSSPAWIVYDMLTSARVGEGLDESRLDLNKWVEWAEYCTANGLECNIVFQNGGNLHDSMQYVLRAGHAQLVMVGTKYSLAIERPDEPVMMFNVASIIKESMEVTWLPKEERINEVEVIFVDKDDSYRQNSVVLRDTAAPLSIKQRVHRLDGYWITSKEQAIKEATFEINQNKFVNHIISFDAPIEAMACTVGDQILVQHDMPNWNVGGRLAAGSTTTAIALDRPVTLEVGKTYKALVHFDAIERYSATIANQGGTGSPNYTSSAVFISGLPGTVSKVTRLKIGAAEYGVSELRSNGATYVAFLDEAIAVTAGTTVALWDTNALEERAVSSVAGTYTSITLSAALPGAPSQFSKWMIGETALVRRPYRVKAISGGDKLIRRIAAIEYNANAYTMTGIEASAPPPARAPLSHVTELALMPTRVVNGGSFIPAVLVTWQPGPNGNYFGADIWVSDRTSGSAGQTFERVAEVRNGRTSFTYPVRVGDTVHIRVVAVDIFGKQTPLADPPTDYIDHVEMSEWDRPDIVTNVVATSEINAVSLTWENPGVADYKAARVYRSVTNDFDDATLLRELDAESYIDPIAPGTTRYYFITAVDFDDNESPPHSETGAAAAARQADGTDIEAGAIDYTSHVVNAPPQYQVLDTPMNGELFQLREHLTGTRTAFPTSKVVTKRFLESPFGTNCYAVEAATTNLMDTSEEAEGGINLTNWAHIGANVTVAAATGGYYLVSNAGGTYQGIKGSVLTAALTDTLVHTGSMYVKNHNLTSVTVKWIAVGSTEQTRLLAPLEEFRIVQTRTEADWTSASNFIQVTVEPGKAVLMTQPQVEQLDFASSFTTGTRAQGILAYGNYGADKDNYQQFMALGWQKFEVARTKQTFIGDWPLFSLGRDGANLKVCWTNGAGIQTWDTGLVAPTDLGWHLLGVEFDKANNVMRAFLDGTYAEQTGAFAIVGTGVGLHLGCLNRTPTSDYTSNSLLSYVQVVSGAGHLTPDEVKQVYDLRKPFSDTAARIDTPEPASVTLEFV